jgi:hypothetical protein
MDVDSPAQTLNPLHSGGLWLAVTMTPALRPRCLTAKYRTGGGTMPTVVTSTPADSIPAASRASYSGELARQSRPVTAAVIPLRRKYVPTARPRRSAHSGSKSASTTPRMS